MSEILLPPSEEVHNAWLVYILDQIFAPIAYEMAIYYQYFGYVATSDSTNYSSSVPAFY